MQFQLPHLHDEPQKNYKTLYVLLYWYVNVIKLQLLEENLYQWDLIIDWGGGSVRLPGNKRADDIVSD